MSSCTQKYMIIQFQRFPTSPFLFSNDPLNGKLIKLGLFHQDDVVRRPLYSINSEIPGVDKQPQKTLAACLGGSCRLDYCSADSHSLKLSTHTHCHSPARLYGRSIFPPSIDNGLRHVTYCDQWN